ncbi:MAG: DMT family transporter [Thermovirgaceae bacterium]|nr:DMT family transporter [Thermovirgaceae bacterium]
MSAWGLLCAVTAALMWGTSGSVIRIADSLGVGIVALNLARALFGSVALCTVALFRRNMRPDAPRVGFSVFLFLGAAGMVMSALGLTVAFLRISVGLAIVIYYSSPCLVMAGSWGLGGGRPSRVQAMAFILALVGIWIAVGGARAVGTFDTTGVVAALVGSAGYALFVLNGKFGTGRIDAFGSFFLTYLLSTAMLGVIAIARGDICGLLDVSPQAWWVLFYLGIATSLIPYGLLVVSLRWIPGSTAAIATMTEVPFSMMWAWIISSEFPEASAVTGGAIVLLAVGILGRSRR